MKYYVRALVPGYWEETSLEKLPGDAICIDWNCSNNNSHNEWSLFEVEVDIPKKTKRLNYVVLRLLIAAGKKFFDGIDFAFFEDGFFQSGQLDAEDEIFNTIHDNYKGVDYAEIKRAVEETWRNRTKLIRYEKSEIANLLKSIGSSEEELSEFKEMIREFAPKKRVNRVLADYNSDFFPDKAVFLIK